MPQPTVASFEEFRSFLSDLLGIAEQVLARDTSFINDLAIDSLKLVELMLQLERQIGQKIPTDAAWEVQTVGDAYELYARLVRQGA